MMITIGEIEKRWLEKLQIKKNKKRHAYVHFDFSIERPEKFLDLVSDENRMASHAFLPFVKFDKPKYKYKNIIESGKRELVKFDRFGKRKVREIMYAGHLDALIYVWYQSFLEILYERALLDHDISSVVIAYRRIQKDEGFGGKCNIDFANAIFHEIKKKGEECVVLTFDIENFFPSLSHSHLKNKWCDLLGLSRLPKDHYNIFKSLTQYSFIDLGSREIKKLLKCRTKGQLAHNHSFSNGAYFSGKIFREIKSKIRELEVSSKKSIFKKHISEKGIPQGSPMSGLLANIYMLDFDLEIKKLIESLGGTYRRYSDDIIIIVPTSHAANAEIFIRERIELEKDFNSKPYLVIKEEKTNRIIFLKNDNGLRSWKLDCNFKIICKKSLQYLGFEFNGKNTFIRSGSVAKIHSKLKFSLRKIEEKYKSGPLLKRKLISKFTSIGKKNFHSYVKKARKIVPTNRFKRQLRKHQPLIKDVVKKLEIK